MPNRPVQNASVPQLSASRRELRRVHLLLARHPSAEASWYWQIRDRVLTFLVRRYSTPEQRLQAESETSPQGSVARRPTSGRRVRYLSAEDAPPSMPIGTEAEPERVADICEHMHHIASVNREVDKTPPPLDLPKPVTPPMASTPRRPRTRARDVRMVLVFWIVLQLPIVAILAGRGYVLLGLLIANGIVLLAIAVAGAGISRARRKPASPAPSPYWVPTTCHRCSYDLRHVRGPRCPECGTLFPRAPIDEVKSGKQASRAFRSASCSPSSPPGSRSRPPCCRRPPAGGSGRGRRPPPRGSRWRRSSGRTSRGPGC